MPRFSWKATLEKLSSPAVIYASETHSNGRVARKIFPLLLSAFFFGSIWRVLSVSLVAFDFVLRLTVVDFGNPFAAHRSAGHRSAEYLFFSLFFAIHSRRSLTFVLFPFLLFFCFATFCVALARKMAPIESMRSCREAEDKTAARKTQ